MSAFIDIAKARRSIRSYRPDPVPRELIERCIEAARFAPSASNTQGWRFIVVQGKLKVRLCEAALGGVIVANKFAFEAPVLIALAMELSIVTHRLGGRIKDIEYHLLDAGIAGEHFVLQAAELGLGTCWIGWFNKKAVKKLLELPSSWDVPALISLGYPKEPPGEKRRKRIEEISSFRE